MFRSNFIQVDEEDAAMFFQAACRASATTHVTVGGVSSTGNLTVSSRTLPGQPRYSCWPDPDLHQIAFLPVLRSAMQESHEKDLMVKEMSKEFSRNAYSVRSLRMFFGGWQNSQVNISTSTTARSSSLQGTEKFDWLLGWLFDFPSKYKV